MTPMWFASSARPLTSSKNNFFVVTYSDDEKNEWHMLMPTELRESLAPSLSFFLDCAMKGVKVPSAKELRIMSALQRFMGDE